MCIGIHVLADEHKKRTDALALARSAGRFSRGSGLRRRGRRRSNGGGATADRRGWSGVVGRHAGGRVGGRMRGGARLLDAGQIRLGAIDDEELGRRRVAVEISGHAATVA